MTCYIKQEKDRQKKQANFLRVIIVVVLFICINYPTQVYSIDQKKCNGGHAITFRPSIGRFGDQICGYSRAKWLSYKYNLPFLFIPFKYSQDLTMFCAEKHADKELIDLVEELIKEKKLTKEIPHSNQYSKMVVVKKESMLAKDLRQAKSPTLFVCRFGTELDCTPLNLDIGNMENVTVNCERDLKNYLMSLQAHFGPELKRMLRPVNPIAIKIPHDRISVAVHVRTGDGNDVKQHSQQYFNSANYHIEWNNIPNKPHGNKTDSCGAACIANSRVHFDADFPCNKTDFCNDTCVPIYKCPIDIGFPCKAPPRQYFIDQIVKLSELLGHVPLYVHIFTDEKDTGLLLREFKKRVNLPNITWNIRIEGNSQDCNVVEDFYAMSQFDCLIRPASNFSLGATLLGNHKIIIVPKYGRWVDEDVLLIDEIDIIFYDQIVYVFNSIGKNLRMRE